MKAVVVFLAEGFEECEALLVVDILRRAGCKVIMASITDENLVKSSRYIEVKADALVKDINFNDADMVVLPGGVQGTKNLEKNPIVLEQCDIFAEKKQVAAICAAPSILAKRGLLKGKAATCHPSYEDKMEDAILTHGSVAVSDNIITGQALGASIPFALELVRQLVSHAEADRIAKSICFTQIEINNDRGSKIL